jgi:stage V sporulation protein B
MLNMYFVYRYVGFTLDIKATLRTVAAAIAMGVAVKLTYHAVMAHTLHNTVATLAAIAVGGGVYGLCILISGGVGEKDIERIPRFGGRLFRILQSLQLLRR